MMVFKVILIQLNIKEVIAYFKFCNFPILKSL